MNEAELRRKGAVGIRLALKGDADTDLKALRSYVEEMDEDDQTLIYQASERLGDAVLDVQARERA